MSSRNRYQCRLSLQITSPLTYILPNATDPMHSTNLPIIDQSEAVALLKGQVPFRPRVIVIKGPQRTFTTCEKGKQLLSSNSHCCTCFLYVSVCLIVAIDRYCRPCQQCLYQCRHCRKWYKTTYASFKIVSQHH